MNRTATHTRFDATLRRPADGQAEDGWAFVVLPKSVSDGFPRRGRTSMQGSMNGHSFQATLEPDGQLSHWFKVPATLMQDAGVAVGDEIAFDVSPAPGEAEPALPPEFRKLLAASAPAEASWHATTTIARIDWIHWIESAKQARTRASRMADAVDMLASGKKRVCCFDPSGFYSKSLAAPRAAE